MDSEDERALREIDMGFESAGTTRRKLDFEDEGASAAARSDAQPGAQNNDVHMDARAISQRTAALHDDIPSADELAALESAVEWRRSDAAPPTSSGALHTERHSATETLVSSIPFRSSCATVTLPDSGERVFVQVRDPDEYLASVAARIDELRSASRQERSKSASIKDMREYIDKRQLLKTIEDSENARQFADEVLRSSRVVRDDSDTEAVDDEGGVDRDSAEKSPKKRKADDESSQWVDKYSPQNFRELLSDEKCNRTILRWLVGFHRGKSEKKVDRDVENVPLVLLSGPPGSGKTTLAHIAAKQAGYKPYEVNASDDRSAGVLVDRVLHAANAQAVFGERKRPCVILDEIDGIAQPAARKLLTLLRKPATSQSNQAKEERDAPIFPSPSKASASASTSSAAKKKSGEVIQSPIIAICNNAYVPALREIRERALVLHIDRVPHERMVERLEEIADHEGIRCEPSALRYLYELSSGDLRSAIHSMQAISVPLRTVHVKSGKSRSQRPVLDITALQRAPVGAKDIHEGLFSVWEFVFSLPAKRNVGMVGAGGNAVLDDALESDDPTSILRREIEDLEKKIRGTSQLRTEGFRAVLARVSAHDDSEKVAMGIFENFLSVRYTDPRRMKTAKVSDHFSHFDLLQSAIRRNQSFALMAYLPLVSIVAHYQCAVDRVPRLTYPRMASQAFVRHQRSSEILRQLHAKMAVPLQPFYANQTALASVVVPLLCRMMAVRIRESNVQLMKKEDQYFVRYLTRLLAAFGIRWFPRGGDRPAMDPDIESLTLYGEADRAKAPPFSIRHYCSARANWRKMNEERLASGDSDAKVEGSNDASSAKEPATCAQGTPEKPAARSIRTSASPDTLSPMDKTPEKEAAKRRVSRGPVDLFGRPIKRARMPADDLFTSQGNPKTPEKENLRFLFRYHEGFTRAVRRPVYLKDIL